jgi:hypothetical protein
MTTAKATKAAKVAKAAKKEPVAPSGENLTLLPAGTLRTHILAIKPASMSVEEYLRIHGYTS